MSGKEIVFGTLIGICCTYFVTKKMTHRRIENTLKTFGEKVVEKMAEKRNTSEPVTVKEGE